MAKRFTLVLNSGRSGSTLLSSLLTENFTDKVAVYHESLEASVTRPREPNRLYEEADVARVLETPEVRSQIKQWERDLRTKDVVECGWTFAHLAPILARIFSGCFQCIILYRNPIDYALSRANMGNYHPRTFYCNSHEVSPFDARSLLVNYRERWENMNFFEKNIFWWYTVYREAFEFKEKFCDQVDFMEMKSEDLFNFKDLKIVTDFIGLKYDSSMTMDGERNPVWKYLRESFPIGDEWRVYDTHAEILEFASCLGYDFDLGEIQLKTEKYSLPRGVGAFLRHRFRYWHLRAKFVDFLRRNLELKVTTKRAR